MKNNKKKIFIEALEQRIMLDGAGASTALDVIDERSKDKLLNNNNKNIYSAIIEKVEKSLIENILDYTNGNQLKASEILGLNRNTLRKKIGDLSIDLKFNDKD